MKFKVQKMGLAPLKGIPPSRSGQMNPLNRQTESCIVVNDGGVLDIAIVVVPVTVTFRTPLSDGSVFASPPYLAEIERAPIGRTGVVIAAIPLATATGEAKRLRSFENVPERQAHHSK